MVWLCAMFIVGDKRGFSFPLATLGKQSNETLAQIDGAWKMGDWQFVPCCLNQWWLLVLMWAGQKKTGTRKWSGPVEQPRLSLLGPIGVPTMSHLSSRPGIKYQLQLSCWYLTWGVSQSSNSSSKMLWALQLRVEAGDCAGADPTEDPGSKSGF